MLQLCLYTRRGCRLCDTVGPLLRELRSEFEFELQVVDIQSHPELESRFGCSIPVVTLDGGNQVAGRVTLDRVRQALSRAQQRRALKTSSPST